MPLETTELFLKALGKVPDVVWSGVISAIVAAGISLLSVRATNRGSAERLRIQHKFDLDESIKRHAIDASEAEAQRTHDARQKAEDRKAAIRREVYTKAIEALHRLLEHFGNLPDVPFGEGKETPPFQEFLAANSKVWLVAESEASHMSRELANQVGEALFAVIQAAHPLRVKLAPLRDLDTDILEAQTALAKIQRRLVDAAEQGEDISRIQQSFERSSAWVKELRRRRLKEEEGTADLRYAFITQSMITLAPVQETLVRLVSALRSELDLAPDLDHFMAQYEEQKRRMTNAVDSAFAS